jgi:hypothetical protein
MAHSRGVADSRDRPHLYEWPGSGRPAALTTVGLFRWDQSEFVMQRRAHFFPLLSWMVIVAGVIIVAVYAVGLCLLGSFCR